MSGLPGLLVFVHYMRNSPSDLFAMSVPSYGITASMLIDQMFTQAPPQGWGVKLRGPGFALRHVEEPTAEDDVEARVTAAFAAENKVPQTKLLSAFQDARNLAPRFVTVGVAVGSDVVHRK
jgi:hypothetical protein